IALADAEGAWLTIDDAELAWQPLKLLTAKLHVDRLAARAINVARQPVTRALEERPERASALPPRLPLSVALEELEVARLELGAPLLGEEAIFRLDCSARADDDAKITSGLEIARLD